MPSVVEPARHSVLLGTTAKAGAGRPAEAPGRAAWPRPGTPATLPVSRGLQRVLGGALDGVPDTSAREWNPQPREERRVSYAINNNLLPLFLIAEENKAPISAARITICITCWLRAVTGPGGIDLLKIHYMIFLNR